MSNELPMKDVCQRVIVRLWKTLISIGLCCFHHGFNRCAQSKQINKQSKQLKEQNKQIKELQQSPPLVFLLTCFKFRHNNAM